MQVDVGKLVSAARVAPGDGVRFTVAWVGNHKTLKAGDVVVMQEGPGPELQNLFIRIVDLTIHSLHGEEGYVLLIPVGGG